jgi:hypothetical protein
MRFGLLTIASSMVNSSGQMELDSALPAMDSRVGIDPKQPFSMVQKHGAKITPQRTLWR